MFASLKCNIRHDMVLDSTVEISATSNVLPTHVHAEYIPYSKYQLHTCTYIYWYIIQWPVRFFSDFFSSFFSVACRGIYSDMCSTKKQSPPWWWQHSPANYVIFTQCSYQTNIIKFTNLFSFTIYYFEIKETSRNWGRNLLEKFFILKQGYLTWWIAGFFPRVYKWNHRWLLR